jgi:Homing endonuclease associated repeat
MGAVREKRAAEARGLREQGMTGIAIAEHMGISRSMAYELLTDPTGEGMRARKRAYDGVCVGCGGRTVSDGSTRPERCRKCRKAFNEENARWLPDVIVEAIRAWAAKHGRQPSATDWKHAGVDHPSNGTVQCKCGSWGEALRLAGFEPQRQSEGKSGGPGALTPEILAETVALYERTGSLTETAVQLKITPVGVRRRLDKAGYPRKLRGGKMPKISKPEVIAAREIERLRSRAERINGELREVEAGIKKWEAMQATFEQIDAPLRKAA